MNLKLGSLCVLLLATGASVANAGCVSCGPGGECFDASPGFSANCECRIRNVNGATICRPSGICDPTDANSCSDDPLAGVVRGKAVSTAFLTPLGEKNPRLAGAMWGALVEEKTSNPAQIGRSYLVAGDYAGTMGGKDHNYSYQTRVEDAQPNGFRVFVTIREDDSGRTEEYEGTLSRNARKGRLMRTDGTARAPVFNWDFPQPR
jgi:hypothetical protein